MENQKGYRDLVTWQRAYKLALAIYQATLKWPKDEMYGLTSQIRRAAVSVAGNIAEGYDRTSPKEYLHHLGYARGSLAELETYLLLAQDLGYLDAVIGGKLLMLQTEVGKLLAGLIRSVSRKQARH